MSKERAARGGPFGKTCSQFLVELFFFGRTGQSFNRGRAALDYGGYVVEVASAHFLLVRNEGVTLVACSKFWFLHHLRVMLHAFAAGVCVSELEGVEPVDVDASQVDELVLVAER